MLNGSDEPPPSGYDVSLSLDDLLCVRFFEHMLSI